MWWSVPAGEFGHMNSHPAVVGEVVELDLAEEGSRDRRGSESPRVGIAAELEAGNEKAKTDAWLGAGDQRELLEDVWDTGSRHCDPDQTALGLGRLDLPSHAGNGDLRAGRLPLVLGAEPSDRFFVGRDVGGTGPDVSRVDDLLELQAGCVVVDDVWRIGAGREFVGAGNGNQSDMDFHGAGTQWGRSWRAGKSCHQTCGSEDGPSAGRLAAEMSSVNMPGLCCFFSTARFHNGPTLSSPSDRIKPWQQISLPTHRMTPRRA